MGEERGDGAGEDGPAAEGEVLLRRRRRRAAARARPRRSGPPSASALSRGLRAPYTAACGLPQQSPLCRPLLQLRRLSRHRCVRQAGAAYGLGTCLSHWGAQSVDRLFFWHRWPASPTCRSGPSACGSAPGWWCRRWWRAPRSCAASRRCGHGPSSGSTRRGRRCSSRGASRAGWPRRRAGARGRGRAIIDINFGCPAKKVTNGLSGLGADARARTWRCGWSRRWSAAVDVPVTVKMRLGWDEAR